MVNSACIEWNGEDYPRITRNGVRYSIQRLMLSIGGADPERSELEVRHLCGNPKCINRDHIVLGTAEQNEADKLIHGTRNRGAEVNTAVLDEDVVRVIRADERSERVLARVFGVHPNTIGKIKRRETWRHVA